MSIQSNRKSSFVAPKSITILPTYRCNAECENCCFHSNPRIRSRATRDAIEAFIEEASSFDSVEVCVFSGGECFLLGDELFDHIKRAKSKGWIVRCVTNGYWARRKEARQRKLLKAIRSGLDEINFSTGDQHARFVEVDVVARAAIAAAGAGLTVVVVIELTQDPSITKQAFVDLLGSLCAESVNRIRVIESPWIPMSTETPVCQEGKHLVNRHNVIARGGCPEVLDSIVLTPSGRLGLCCGLTREKIPELNKELVSGGLQDTLANSLNDFTKIWLRVEGPEKILAKASLHDPSIDWENRFAHRCDACRFLFNSERVQEALAGCYQESLDSVMKRFALHARIKSFKVGVAEEECTSNVE